MTQAPIPIQRLLAKLEGDAWTAFANALDAATLDAARREFFEPGSGRFKAVLREIFALASVADRQASEADLNATIRRIGDRLESRRREMRLVAPASGLPALSASE